MTQRLKHIIAVIAGLMLLALGHLTGCGVLQSSASIDVQTGSLANQAGTAITVTGVRFPANKEIYVGLAAPGDKPMAGTTLATVLSDKDGKFRVTFPYPTSPGWATLPSVTVYAGTPDGSHVGTYRLSLPSITTLVTPAVGATSPLPSSGGATGQAPTVQPTPRGIVLPVKRQVAPSDIQADVPYFDGGAGGGDLCGYYGERCGWPTQSSSSDMWMIQYAGNGSLYEGLPVAACVKGLPPQSQFKWTLETPRGAMIEGTNVSKSDGSAMICPGFDYLRGSYRIRATAGSTVLSTKFEMLSAKVPSIWTAGLLAPGKTITVYYAGFRPTEVITTVWYSSNLWDVFSYSSTNPPRLDYLTSWQIETDPSGLAMASVSIPDKACVPKYSLLVAQTQRNVRRAWPAYQNINSNFDILATAAWDFMAEGTNCPPDPEKTTTDSSSRFLIQSI